MSAAERSPNIGRLGVGLAAIGRPAYINLGRTDELGTHRSVDELRAVSWAVLDEAYAAGVRWVDVARSYGRAEEFLAGWLTERQHGDVVVSSKWGYAYVGDWRLDAPVHEVKEHSLARFTAQLAETRALLGNRLGLYQVHSLTTDSPLFGDRELQEALARLCAHGVRVGFSTSGPAQADTVRRALALTAQGQPVFTAVQSTWNPARPAHGARSRRRPARFGSTLALPATTPLHRPRAAASRFVPALDDAHGMKQSLLRRQIGKRRIERAIHAVISE